jgi:hypothetical protein
VIFGSPLFGREESSPPDTALQARQVYFARQHYVSRAKLRRADGTCVRDDVHVIDIAGRAPERVP